MRDSEFLLRMRLCEWESEGAELHRGDVVADASGGRYRVLSFDARKGMALVAGEAGARRLPASSLEVVGEAGREEKDARK